MQNRGVKTVTHTAPSTGTHTHTHIHIIVYFCIVLFLHILLSLVNYYITCRLGRYRMPPPPLRKKHHHGRPVQQYVIECDSRKIFKLFNVRKSPFFYFISILIELWGANRRIYYIVLSARIAILLYIVRRKSPFLFCILCGRKSPLILIIYILIVPIFCCVCVIFFLYS